MSPMKSIPIRSAAFGVALLGLASAQEESQPTVEARVEAVLAEHAGGDVAEALARLDALVGADGVDPAPIRASRYRLRMALGQRQAALEDLRWLLEEASAEWRTWARGRAGEVAGDMDPDRRIRDLVTRVLSGVGSHNEAREQLSRLGAPAVPTLIDVLRGEDDTESTETLVYVLIQIDASEAVEWLSSRLASASDPVVGLQVAKAIERAPEGTRPALAGAALDSPDATIRRFGLAAWPGNYGERELAVAREFPGAAAEALSHHDPRGSRGLQQQVWEALETDDRRRFAEAAVRADILDVDPELLPRLLQWPDVTLTTWDRLPRDVRRGAQEAAGEALRAMRGKTVSLPGAMRFTATTQTGSGRSPWEQLLEDVVDFGWRELVDELLPLLDHPGRGVSDAASRALYRIAPRALFEHLRATDREVPEELWVFGNRDDLDAMVGAVLGQFRQGGVTRLARVLLDRILDVATAADLQRLDAVHRGVMEANHHQLADRWRDWLRQHAEAITAARMLELEPRDWPSWEVAGAAAAVDDVPAITALVRAALAANQQKEARFLVGTLQRLDADDALTTLAREHLVVLDWLDDSDLDRLPLWRQRLADGTSSDELELYVALEDPQVATAPDLVDAALSTIVERGGLSEPMATSLQAFLGRVPPARAAAFADAAWSRVRADVTDASDARLAALALRQLGADRDPARIPRFAEALELPSEIVQRAAVEQLARTFAPAAVPHLLAAMRSDHRAVAQEAAAALERLDSYFRTERAWRDRFQELDIPWPATTRDR